MTRIEPYVPTPEEVQTKEHQRVIIADFNADKNRRADVINILKDAAREHYAPTQGREYHLRKFSEVVGDGNGYGDAKCQLIVSQKLQAEIGEYLIKNNFKEINYLDGGMQAIAFGDGEKAARICALGQGAANYKITTPQFLKPLSSKTFYTDRAGRHGRKDMLVEIMPQLLTLDSLRANGKISDLDALLVGISVGGSIHREHPHCRIDDSSANMGLLPDGTPILFDRDGINPMVPEAQIYADGWKAIADDFNWKTPDGKWKQDAFFPKEKALASWADSVGDKTSRTR